MEFLKIKQLIENMKPADLPMASESGTEVIQKAGYYIEYTLKVEWIETHYQPADWFHPAEWDGYAQVQDITDLAIYRGDDWVELSMKQLSELEEVILHKYLERY